MRGHRSKLSAVRRKKKDGAVVWMARGFVPVRRPDGTFARQRVEHRLGGHTATSRQAEIDTLSKGYEERALHVPLTFARAYINYVESGKPVPLYAERILDQIGVMQCAAIDDTVMVALKKTLFRADAAAAYVNRHLHTPVAAILRQSLREHAPQLTRPKGHKDVAPMVIPDQSWFRLVSPHMGPATLALVMFLTVHGRRLGDALGRRPSDFDPVARTLSIGKTKTGDPLLIDMHPGVAAMIDAMPGWRDHAWLFRDGPTSPSNVRKDIAAACRAAGVPYFAPHALGRHSFATRMLRAGYSMQYVKDAGGWATIEMVAKRYGHLEKREVTTAVHLVGDDLMGSTLPVRGGKMESLPPPQASAIPATTG